MPQIPQYEEIAEDLRRRIASGEFADGRLPTQKDLVEQYGGSLQPVKSAMLKLEVEGVIVRRHGARAVVRPQGKAGGGPRG